MGRRYASGRKAKAFCDRCGFEYKLHELKDEVVDMHETGLKVCPECWDPDQPQLQVGRWPVSDPQALESPRPLGEDAGRQDGWLVYNYDNIDNWTSQIGQLYRDTANRSLIFRVDEENETNVKPGFVTDVLSINAAYYRWARLRFKILERPTNGWSPLFYMGVNVSSTWRFGRDYVPENMPSKSEFLSRSDQIIDLTWDFSKEARPLDEGSLLYPVDYPWNETIDRIRCNPLLITPPDKFKIEILDLSFIPQRIQPPVTTTYGVVNGDFSSPEFNRGVPGSYTVESKEAEAIPGWLATPRPILPSGPGSNEINRVGQSGITDAGGPFSGVDWNGRLVYMRPNYSPTKVSQLTSTSFDQNREYTVSADFYRLKGNAAPKYAMNMISGSSLLSSASTPIPEEGEGVTVSASYTVRGDESLSDPMKIEFVNQSTDATASPLPEVDFGNVRISSKSGQVSRWIDFADGVAGWAAVNGTVSAGAGKTLRLTSTGNTTDNFSVRLRLDNITGLLANDCMKMRMKFRIIKQPQADFYGGLKFRRHYSTNWQTLQFLAKDPGLSSRIGEWMFLEWDMVGSAGGWTDAIQSLEWIFYESGTGSTDYPNVDDEGIVEVQSISLEKFPEEPAVDTQYGIKNWSFTSPTLWSPAATTKQHFGNTETAVPGWVCDEKDPPLDSTSGNIGIASHGSLLPDGAPGCYITTHEPDVGVAHPIGVQQLTGEVIQKNTRYWLQADVGRRTNDLTEVSYKTSMSANGVVLVSSDTLYQESKVNPAPGESLTSTCTFRVGNEDSAIGYPITVRLENTGAVAAAGNVNYKNIKLISEPVPEINPVVSYAFDAPQQTLTSPASSGNSYGIDGWAYWDSGTNPQSGSLTASGGTVSLNTGDSWDSPLFTLWDERSPGIEANVPTSEVDYVRIKMRRTVNGTVPLKTWSGQFYWVVQSRVDQGLYPFVPNSNLDEPNFILDEWIILTWELGNIPAWREEGIAKGFRFGFYTYDGVGTRDAYEIDYIQFLKDI